MTDGWIGGLSQSECRVWFWLMRSVREIRVNFFPKEYFWGEHLYQPGKSPKGKTPVATQRVMESLVE
ncbi:hypothetical protein [Laspinema palackyanum]|uniref:hypothetical protein n=1 Tax=Laspinema palackyanum TaxID=3231601 RepID=UPI00345DA1E5|nr:hypothetical protein [Laspinema sp. D2c]